VFINITGFCVLSRYLFPEQTRPEITTSYIHTLDFCFLDFMNKTSFIPFDKYYWQIYKHILVATVGI